MARIELTRSSRTLLLAAALVLPAIAAGSALELRQGGRFVNPFVTEPRGGVLEFLRLRLFGGHEWAGYDATRDGAVPVARPAAIAVGEASANATVTWIGHATVLLQHKGINVLTDPLFGDRVAPLPFVGPRRIVPAALSPDELPPIHAVVISHDHFDHLDLPSIRALGDGPRYFVPLGVAPRLAAAGIDRARITELDWWQATELRVGDERLEMVATPTQHVSGRGLTDRNRTLWAGWALRWEDFSAWFAGDTGYNDVQFRAIGEVFGGFDLGILPIGSYAPRSYMSQVHVDPAQAVQMHRDIGARRSMAMHWGTFHLTAEPLLEPPRLLEEAVVAAGLSADAFEAFAVGETRRFAVSL